MDNVIIRKAELSDSAAIARIWTNDLGYPCESGLVKEKLSALDENREAVYIAVCGNETVGVVHVEKYNLLYSKTLANILGLAVREEYRRRGIGKTLMQTAENWAKENGISSMRLNSGGKRSEAHEFYRSIGYDSEKVQIRFMKNLDDNSE